MEKIAWLVLGGVVLGAAVRAGNSSRALVVGRVALGVLFIVFGSLVNVIYLLENPEYYAPFADPSPFAFVRETWGSLVMTHLELFITLLIVFEALMGVLVLSGGQRTRVGLIGLIGFHVAALAFGGVLWPWALVMLTSLVLLLRAERAGSSASDRGRAARSDHLPVA